jgi:hypothetical protein
MVPLAAAASVAAIAAVSVVVPLIWTGQRAHTPAPIHALAQGYPNDVMPAAARPKFFVAITYGPNGNTTNLEVVSSATGRVVGHLAPPARYRYFQAVAALGSNSTFVAEASGRRCDTWFYQFKLNSRGRPVDLAPLAVPEVPGRPIEALAPDPASFAASADGTVVAYASTRCSGPIRTYYGQVGAISVAAAKVTTWRFRWPAQPVSLSLTADGRLLEMVSNPSDGSAGGYAGGNAAWVVRTASPPGRLERRYRRVFGPPNAPTAAVLSPNGAITFAVTPVQLRHGRAHELFSAYRTATGRRIRDILVFGGISQGPTLNADVSGRYLLAFFLTDRVKWVDLATGRLMTIPGFGGSVLDLAW